ncbi:hypothetical protein [Ensifer aridi]|nr:hypothetical protein [Ensifer aridi]
MALVADGRHYHAAVPMPQMLTRGLRDNTVSGHIILLPRLILAHGTS